MDEFVPTPPPYWPDEVDEIFGGDLVVAVGTVTPKRGVALVNVIPLGLRDRQKGTVGFTTSLGFGKKLERIAANPQVALAYHTRQHGHSHRTGHVLVQGTASVTEFAGEWILAQALRYDERFQAARGRFWDWWLKVYYMDRVLVDVRVHRILWWPDDVMSAEPIVLGKPLPQGEPPSQPRPHKPETARVKPRKVARSARKGHSLIGVVQADGMPLIVPFDVVGTDERGLTLSVDCRLLPSGERRAGLLAHDFHPKLIGLWTATHTGWLVAEPEPVWTPHTRHYFYAPPNETLLLLGNGFAARRGYRRAMKKRATRPAAHPPGPGSPE